MGKAENLVSPTTAKAKGPLGPEDPLRNDLYKALSGDAHTQAILNWLTGLGKLTEYRLAVKIAEDLEKEAEAEAKAEAEATAGL